MPKAKAKAVKARVPRTRGGGRYTEAGFFGYIRAGLRAKFFRWGPRFDVLAAAKRKARNPAGRIKFEYECAICNNLFPQKQVEVDHIVPCGSLKTYEDLPGFVERMFVEEDGLRVLCKPCHLTVTKEARDAKSSA